MPTICAGLGSRKTERELATLEFVTNASGKQADQICYADRVYTNPKAACGEPILDANGKPTGKTSGYKCPCKDTEKTGTVNGHCTGALTCHGDTANGRPLEPLKPLNSGTPSATPPVSSNGPIYDDSGKLVDIPDGTNPPPLGPYNHLNTDPNILILPPMSCWGEDGVYNETTGKYEQPPSPTLNYPMIEKPPFAPPSLA